MKVKSDELFELQKALLFSLWKSPTKKGKKILRSPEKGCLPLFPLQFLIFSPHYIYTKGLIRRKNCVKIDPLFSGKLYIHITKQIVPFHLKNLPIVLLLMLLNQSLFGYEFPLEFEECLSKSRNAAIPTTVEAFNPHCSRLVPKTHPHTTTTLAGWWRWRWWCFNCRR